MSDIVERLRDRMTVGLYWDVARDAADEITILRQQLASARDAALEEAAVYFDDLASHHAAAHAHVESDHHARMERQRQIDATAIRSLKSGQEAKR